MEAKWYTDARIYAAVAVRDVLDPDHPLFVHLVLLALYQRRMILHPDDF